MIVVFAVLSGMTIATITGGRFRRFASLDMRCIWLIWLTIIVQTLLFELPPTIVTDDVYAQIHLATYAAAFLFLWLNRHIPGALIIGAGAGANAVAIAANGGVMPASPAAWRTAGLEAAAEGDFANSDITPDANLAFLGDIFAIPASWPLSNVFSIGDIVIVLGGTYFAYVWSRREPTSDVWPAPSSSNRVDAVPTRVGAAGPGEPLG